MRRGQKRHARYTHHRGAEKPLGVAYRVKEHQRFLHLVRVLVLDQAAVVARQSDEKEDSRDPLEAVNPFLALRALPANVKYPVDTVVDGKRRLDDTSRLVPTAQNIRICRLVLWVKEAVQVGKVAANRGRESVAWPKRLACGASLCHAGKERPVSAQSTTSIIISPPTLTFQALLPHSPVGRRSARRRRSTKAGGAHSRTPERARPRQCLGRRQRG